MACSFENYGTFATAKSRIKVFDFHHAGKKVPYTCILVHAARRKLGQANLPPLIYNQVVNSATGTRGV